MSLMGGAGVSCAFELASSYEDKDNMNSIHILISIARIFNFTINFMKCSYIVYKIYFLIFLKLE